MNRNDTIVARATPLGTGGIAIVRVSGPGALRIATGVFRSNSHGTLSHASERYLVYGTIHSEDGIVDHCLAVRFQAPHSFTGEDVVEFHLHGSALVAEQVVDICARSGARLATPGEFTQRAFLNGKVDITQVEALADILAVESEQALYIAQRQLHGELRERLQRFRERVLEVLALLELELDFVQEGYQFASTEEVEILLEELREFVGGLHASYHLGNRLRKGPRVLLLGRPNAGKSSLFNAVVGFGRAIVSPTAGTTRDYLEERVSHGGVQFRLVDTAGLRATSDPIEAAGVGFAEDLVATSDHVLYLIDGTRVGNEDLELEVRQVAGMRAEYPETTFTVVCTKSDIGNMDLPDAVHCSVHDRASVVGLLERLVQSYSQDLSEAVALVSDRQYRHVLTLREMLAGVEYRATSDTELLSADLRMLLEPLAELTGNIVSDDILNTLFGSFCIGK